MARPADELAMYEALTPGAAGGGPAMAADRDRAARVVERLRRAGWALLPVGPDGTGAWLDKLTGALSEGETLDDLVADLLSTRGDESGDPDDPDDRDDRILQLEEELRRHDIEVPEWE